MTCVTPPTPDNVADNDSNAPAEIKAHLIKVYNILDFLFSFQERPRPTFAALAPAVERNPVTGLLEPHFPPEKRFPRVVSGIAIIGLMVQYFFTVFFFHFVLFSGKGYTVEHIFLKTWDRKLIEYDFFKFSDRYLSGKCHSSICTLQKLFPKHNCFPVPVNPNKTSSSTIQSRRFRAFNGIHAFTIWC